VAVPAATLLSLSSYAPTSEDMPRKREKSRSPEPKTVDRLSSCTKVRQPTVKEASHTGDTQAAISSEAMTAQWSAEQVLAAIPVFLAHHC